jgi:GntR family transcriptional regulator, transcriptional repressor for pyruvate dehydrogenase complex
MPPPFQRVNSASSASLPDLAAEAIRASIARGGLAPGDALPPERVLTEQLGVSRTVLREALKMLESMGMVEARVGKGRFVTVGADDNRSLALVRNWLHAHREEIEDLNEIRTAMESIAVARISPDERVETAKRLNEIIAEARLAVERGDSVRAAALDSEFHRTLCGRTANRPLQALVGGMIDAAQEAALAVYSLPAAAAASLREHTDIARALAEEDVVRVRAHLDHHFRRAVAVAAGVAREPRR